jgi:hypothetical protein
MLTPFDDYPIHQTSLPVAHAASSDPNHYDRFWFNGYTEDYYFAAGMAVYPNRGIIDAAFATVHDGVQRSVFASGRMPIDRGVTRVGPLSIEIVEPLRVTRVVADAADLGIEADVTFTARTASLEEARQILTTNNKINLDSTRMTQWGWWDGTITTGGDTIKVEHVRATKDRSWGVRPVGPPAGGAPDLTLPQVFFRWAPIHWEQQCTHFLCFERGNGDRLASDQAVLDVVAPGAPMFGPDADATIHHLPGVTWDVQWAPGLRRSQGATLRQSHYDGTQSLIELEPLLTFRMRGLGYMHPEWGHGHWHGELATGSEEHKVEELDNVEPWNIHIQQVMRATWGDQQGLGVLEQLAIGDHTPSGLHGIIDGYTP